MFLHFYQIPSPDRWWGEPKPIQIKYTRLTSENDTKRLQVKTFPVTSVNHTVLEGLNSSEQYMVHPIGCNRRHCSQGTGYRIEALDGGWHESLVVRFFFYM